MRNDAISVITETVRAITSRGFDPLHAPWDHKVCVMVHAAQGIIDNGGFAYFFETPFEGDPTLDDFPLAFTAIGAFSSAAAMSEALKRNALGGSEFSDLDTILWRESPGNLELLASYVRGRAESYA